MPSFDGVLSTRQISQVIQYLRSLCRESGWPIGELNVPWALVTEKAFPESEVVLTTTVNTTGARGVTNEIDYEQAFGKWYQLEMEVAPGFKLDSLTARTLQYKVNLSIFSILLREQLRHRPLGCIARSVCRGLATSPANDRRSRRCTLQ